MHRMKSVAVRTSAIAVLAAILTAGCTETSGPSGQTGSGAQNLPILMGGFHINTAPVTTNQDGTSKNIIDDYVTLAQLPNVNFEVFTIHLLAPTASDVETDLSNVSVRVQRTDGTRTGNLLQSVQYESEMTVGGQRYDVYQIDGFYNVSPTLTKSNFANVTFEADLSYQTGSGSIQRPVTLSVYKRN